MKMALLGCKGTTLDLLSIGLAEKNFSFDCIITLPTDIAQNNEVAFYCGTEVMACCKKHNIPVYASKTYHLKDEEDYLFFKKAKIDVLVVLGWERLIPERILKTLGKFACGMHGSPYGLPKGRGRSPLNWSIITGHSKFITYLFAYTAFMDAGDILGFKSFDINPFDTIATLHAKNRICMYELLKTFIPLIQKGKIALLPQPPEKPTFYPKRTAEDGGIDWNQCTAHIYNLIRAVTCPYPAAYCYYGKKKISILEAYPFDTALFHSCINPGTVVDVSIALGNFVVKTIDGSLIVKKFKGVKIEDIKIGDVLKGISHNRIMRRILERYSEDIPDDQREIK